MHSTRCNYIIKQGENIGMKCLDISVSKRYCGLHENLTATETFNLLESPEREDVYLRHTGIQISFRCIFLDNLREILSAEESKELFLRVWRACGENKFKKVLILEAYANMD